MAIETFRDREDLSLAASRGSPLGASPDSRSVQDEPAPILSSHGPEKYQRILPPKPLQVPSSTPPRRQSHKPIHKLHCEHNQYHGHDGHDRIRSQSKSLTHPRAAAAGQERQQRQSRASVHHRSRDPEKVEGRRSYERELSHSYSGSPLPVTVHYQNEDCEGGQAPEEHSVWILIYLSSLSPFLALLFALYTVLTTTIILLLFPFGLFCTERRPLCNQLHFFLSPPIAFQLGLIYSDLQVPKTSGDRSSLLVLVNLCSPFYGVWIATSAWVAAFFWAFAAIMGNPDGKDGKDDGRATVMGVRRWWERWLERGLR